LRERGAWAYPGTAEIFGEGLPRPIISGTGKDTNFKFGHGIHSVHENKNPLKIREERERGRIHVLPKFLEYCPLSQDRVKLRTSNFADTFTARVHPNKSPLKILGKRSVGVGLPGTAEIFSVPLIISRTGKATNKFCTHILSIDRNKSPLQISGKVAVGTLRTVDIFQGTHRYWTHRAVVVAIVQLSRSTRVPLMAFQRFCAPVCAWCATK